MNCEGLVPQWTGWNDAVGGGGDKESVSVIDKERELLQCLVSFDRAPFQV